MINEVWACTENRIAVRFAYEWHDVDNNWFRAYGNENWEFAANGVMQQRLTSINDRAIQAAERKLRWPAGPRPANALSLTDLDL